GVIADPVWTGDGGLLFVAEQTGLPQVYRWSDSLGAVQLTHEPLGARAPAALPDGSLLYATLSARGWRLSRGRPAAAAAPAPADASVDSEWSRAVLSPGDTSVAERDQNAAVGATFVVRRFRTSASLRVAAEYEGNRFVVLPAGTPLAAACSACRVRDLVGGSLSLGVAHFVTAPLAISRQDGFAWA